MNLSVCTQYFGMTLGKVFLISLAASAATARANELVATRPGVMCILPQALSKLTLPDGSSRSAKPGASPGVIATKLQGGCIDIQIGSHVTLLSARLKTSIIQYDSGHGPQQFIAPNIDFKTAGITPSGIESRTTKSDSPASESENSPNSQMSVSGDKLYESPRLDGLLVALIDAKLNGTPPDFETYAEKSDAYTNANSFDREAVLGRQKARLKALYDGLNVKSPFLLIIEVGLRQYDPTVGGYPLDWSDAHYVPFRDPVSNELYQIQLKNESDFNVVPISSAEAARALTRKFNFSDMPDSLNGVLYEVVVRIDDILPATTIGETALQADVLAAKIMARNGALIHEFRARTGDGAATDSAPHVADIQGIKLGMSAADAHVIGSRGWTLERDALSAKGKIFANNFVATQHYIACGLNDYTAEASVARNALSDFDGDFSDCLAYKVDDTGTEEKVVAVYAAQTINVSFDTIRGLLIKKYGKPSTSELGNPSLYGSNDNTRREITGMIWLLPSSDIPERKVKLTATLEEDGGKRKWLRLSLVPYVDPNERPALPTAEGAPKL